MSDFDAARERSRRLMAASPLAIPLQRALQNMAERRETLLQPPVTPPADFAAPEPIPPLDGTEAYAASFFSRLMHSRGDAAGGQSAATAPKPRLVVSNDNDPELPAK